jgi:hypothetical protein
MINEVVGHTTGESIPPQPDEADLLQVELPLEVVPVKHDGPVFTHELPSRVGVSGSVGLTTAWVKVLYKQLQRKCAYLICDVDWHYIAGGPGTITGTGPAVAPWYAKVPLPLHHGDEVWAKVPTSTGTLTVLEEIWAP